jgi:hypothetical protein
MAPVPSSVSVHWEFAEGEEILDQLRGNDPVRVRCAPLKPTNVVQLPSALDGVFGIFLSREVFKVCHAANAGTCSFPCAYLYNSSLPSHAARAFAENRHAATSRRTCS